MNVYWASQHYDDLAGIRRQQGLRDDADTPPFLVLAHASAMNDRAGRGGKVEHKVRQIARRVMSELARDRPATADHTPASRARAAGRPRADAESGWKQPDIPSPHLSDVNAGHPGEGT
ncbi:MAG TPA: hypothetical protein VE733_30370 [Streptosporangiaceae bacterium]|jgi:hypothetical protein|nr:hypothetical protein [Streptosporangiaceae bacterium]